jgi:hypothetical protein
LNPWIRPVMIAASVCLDYALLWFALWWDLFGESIRNQT